MSLSCRTIGAAHFAKTCARKKINAFLGSTIIITCMTTFKKTQNISVFHKRVGGDGGGGATIVLEKCQNAAFSVPCFQNLLSSSYFQNIVWNSATMHHSSFLFSQQFQKIVTVSVRIHRALKMFSLGPTSKTLFQMTSEHTVRRHIFQIFLRNSNFKNIV